MMQEDSNGDFEIVDKKMAGLLASDPSGGGSSVLTNVAPPSALPSFLASPLPAASSSILPPAPVPISPAVSVPYNPAEGNVVRAPGGAPVPSPGPVPGPPSGVHPPSGVPPPTGVPPPSLPVKVTSASPTPFPPTSPSPPQVAVPASSHPLTLSPSHPVASQAQGPPFVPSSGPSLSMTSHPQAPPIRQDSTVSLKGHSRHHSYPVYVPGNPMHNPPPPPTPPCLIVQQEQVAPSVPLSKSHSHLSCYPMSSSIDSVECYYRETAGNSVQMNIADHNVSYNYYGYPSGSAGNVDASVDLGSPGVGGGPPRPGWFGWIRGTVSNVGHRVAEKARSSMDTMITTLDPQMKEFIHSGGDIDIVVASDKEVKVGAIREAFQLIFGKATVVGIAAQSESIAAQPVGFAAALQSAEERINSLRSSGRVHPQQPVVSVENFIVELTPECWYDLGLLLLDDPGEDIILQTYTQVTPIPPDFVTQARAATQEDYPFKISGFAATVGSIASQSLQIHHSLWQETLTGVPRRDLIVLAARTLAGLYKSRLPRSH